MADLTVTEFRARFSEFDETSYPDATIEALIEDTLCAFSQSRWDCYYKRGHSLYIAHLLVLRTQQQKGQTGTSNLDALQSKTADGVSGTFATMTPETSDEAFFAGTSYGREYLMLKKQVGIGAACCCSPVSVRYCPTYI